MHVHLRCRFAAVASQYGAEAGAEARRARAKKAKQTKPDRFNEGKSYANAYLQVAQKWGGG